MSRKPDNPSTLPKTELDDSDLFRREFNDIQPIEQDKITPKHLSSKDKSTLFGKTTKINQEVRQASASFHFSDGFEAHFSAQGPLKYVRPDLHGTEVKRLRRGEIPPDLILDLHGLNRESAKLEIAALIVAAKRQHAHCVCIIHGVGGQVLKHAVPNWLVQHPAVEGFHQAPLEWGGKGALLVLIEQPDELQLFK